MGTFQETLWSMKPLQISSKCDFPSDRHELLCYYRSRIERSEWEREDWVRHYEGIRVKQDELHKAEWEIKSRVSEHIELTRQLNERKKVLNEGRDKLVLLARENENLMKQQQVNKDKLMKFYDLTEPVQQDVFFKEGERPVNLYSYSGAQNTKGAQKPKYIIRTMHLPSSQNETLSKEKEELLQQIEAQRGLYRTKLEEAHERARTNEDSTRTAFEKDGREIEGLLQRLLSAQRGKLSVTRDLLQLRHELESKERALVEQLGQDQMWFDAVLKEHVHSYSATQGGRQKVERMAQQQAQDFAEQFRGQATEAQGSLQVVKDQHYHLQGICKGKLRELEERYSAFCKKYSELESRTDLEVEGYKTEIGLLTEKIQRVKNPPPAYPRPAPKQPEEEVLCVRCCRGVVS